MTAEELRQKLAFYRDLGIEEIYRRPGTAVPSPAEKLSVEKASVIDTVPSPAILAAPAVLPQESEIASPMAANPAIFQPAPEVPSLPKETAPPVSVQKPQKIETVVPEVSPVGIPKPSFELPPLHPAGDSMLQIRQDIGEDCRRCRLCEGRTNLVFGSGNEKSPLVFVGEGPGADEDEQGLPFVGRAGQLLTQMINNTTEKEGIPVKREDVYICNVVKCRPPNNRAPQPDEMEICGQFLSRQLSVIQPKAIVTLGATASKALLDMKEGITKARGKWHKWQDVPVMVTYHPSYLLRNQSKELRREVWEDLKAVFHFVYDK